MATKPILKLFDVKKIYLTPIGEVLSGVDVLKQYPGAAQFPYVLETDEAGEAMLSFDPLNKMLTFYNVPRGELTDEEAVEALAEAIYQTRLAAEGDPKESSPEERTAAALEALVMGNMETVNDDDPDVE